MGIGSTLDALFRNLSPSAVTDVFIVVMLAAFAYAIHCAKTRKHPAFYEHAPSLLTSLGILGTFLGIVLGLLDFDPEHIEESIRILLGGLKTAFFTSLIGMLFAVVFKGVDTFFFADRPDTDTAPKTVTPLLIYQSLKMQQETLKSLERAIAGSEEGTLVGQMKLLRSDIGDFRSSVATRQLEFEAKLFEQMKDFANLLAESATSAVINALRDVIEDFNKHLVEQFGDNFKALDESVKKMVDWQESYKNHVEQLEGRLEVAVVALERTSAANEKISISIEASEKSVASISEQCARIPPAMDNLKDVVEVNQHQIRELAAHLESFVEMRAKAVDAVPKLQEQMERLTDGIRSSLDKVLVSMMEGATEFGQHSDRVNTALGQAANTISNQSERIATDLDDAAKGFNSSARGTLETIQQGTKEIEAGLKRAIDQASESIAENVGRAVSQMESNINQVAERTLRSMSDSVRESTGTTLASVEQQVKSASEAVRGSLNTQLETFQKGLERELELVLRDLASGLATISRRLADDHERLSRRLGS